MPMKLKLGKSFLKALEAGAGAAAAAAGIQVQTSGSIDPTVTGLVGLIAGVIRGIINIVKTIRKIRSSEKVG